MCPVVGLTLRPVHPTRRSASDAQIMQKFRGARTGSSQICACRHSTFERTCITESNYFLFMCGLRAGSARQLSLQVAIIHKSSVYNVRASFGRRKSFVFVAGIQGSKSSPSRHRLHAKFQNFSSTYPPCRYRAPQPTPRRDYKPILVGISGRLGRLCGRVCLFFPGRTADTTPEEQTASRLA